jgi:hypothetical protein
MLPAHERFAKAASAILLLRADERFESFHAARVIHVALVASVNPPHVRFASESDRIAAQQRNDAQCQELP